MAVAEDLTCSLKDVLNGVKSSLNYSIENVSEICEETGGGLLHVEEELDLAHGEISDLIRSLDKLRKTCVQCRQNLLHAVKDSNETAQKETLEKLERLTTLKGQFEERERALRNHKNELQKQRRELLEVLQRAEEALNKLRLSKELLFSRSLDSCCPTQPQDLRLAVLTLQFAEQERLRLARELHDGPAQLFAAAILLMELVQKLLSMGDLQRAGDEVGNVKEQMKDSLGDIRTFLWHLNPQALDDGLKKGLFKLAEHVRSREVSNVEVHFAGSDCNIAPTHAVNIFRIVQEAMNNAIKNGKARHIQISVSVENEELQGYVSDDGCGFDVEVERKNSKERGSFGLSNMENRARLLGGNCTLESTPGKGTTVSFRVPIGGGVYP